MTTTPIVGGGELVSVSEPLFTDGERAALAGFLTGYSGLTREATRWTGSVALTVRTPGWGD
jgi:hypothetical protein